MLHRSLRAGPPPPATAPRGRGCCQLRDAHRRPRGHLRGGVDRGLGRGLIRWLLVVPRLDRVRRPARGVRHGGVGVGVGGRGARRAAVGYMQAARGLAVIGEREADAVAVTVEDRVVLSHKDVA